MANKTRKGNGPAPTPAAKKAEATPVVGLAAQIEETALELLGLVGKGTVKVKEAGIEAAADGLGNIAGAARVIQSERDGAIERLEELVVRFERDGAEHTAAQEAMATLKAELAEAVEANAGYQGIEDALTEAKAEVAKVEKAMKAEVAKATKAAKAEAANDIKLAGSQRDAAKKASKDAEARLGSIKADLLARGIGCAGDFDAMVAEAATAKEAVKAMKVAEAKTKEAVKAGKVAEAKAKLLEKQLAAAKTATSEAEVEDLRVQVAVSAAALMTATSELDAAKKELGIEKGGSALAAGLAEKRMGLFRAEIKTLKAERDAALAIKAVPPPEPVEVEGSGIEPEPFEPEPKNVGEAIASRMVQAMAEGVAMGIDPVVITAVLPALQAAVLDAATRLFQPLFDAGLLSGSIPTSADEFAALTGPAVAMVEGADKNEAFRLAAAGFVKLLSQDQALVEKAQAFDHIHLDGGGLYESRLRLDQACGDECKANDDGTQVWGVRVPTLIGFALRQRGDKMVALGHQVRLWQPFTVVVKGEDGTNNYTVSRIVSKKGQLKLIRPDEQAGQDGASTILSGDDTIVRVHRTPAIKATGLNAAQAASALAISKGFTPGRGSMEIPKGVGPVVDVNGRPLPGCPVVNLDAIADRLYEEAAALS